MSKFTAASGSLYLNLYIETSGQPNVGANTSNVAWRVTVSRSGAYYTYNEDGSSTLTVDVNGTRVNTSNPRWHTSGEEFTLASGTTTVGHNADGKKTVSASVSFNPNNGVHGAVSVSGSLTLPTIPRASSVSIGATTIGSAVTLTVTRASTSFTHTLRYAWGSTSGTIATGVGTSASWTPPMSLCTHIPSATSGNGTIYVDTYSGSTKIGTKSIPFTASVPSSVKPTFTSATLTDLTSSTAALITGNTFVEILSNIQVTWNGASGAYGSSITGYRAEIANKNLTVNTNGGSFGPLNFDGSYTIRTSVLDSRGRWSDTKDYAIVLLNYHAPALTFKVKRGGTNMDKIVVERNAMVAPLTVGTTQKNTMSLSYSVAPLGSTTFTADTGGGGTWTTLATLTNNEATLNGTYAPNKSWLVRGILSDKFLSTPFEAIVTTESAIYHYDKDGRFGVGKVVDSTIPPGSLDVKGNIYAGGKQIQQHQLTQNDSLAIRVSGDWNNVLATGFYMGYNMTNQPTFAGMHGWKYVRVTRHNDLWVLQEAVDFNGAVSCYRVKLNNVWQPWEQIVTADHPMLQEKPLKTLTMGFPYGMKANLVRKGDVVTISLIRNIHSVDSFEHAVMQEKIPAGYRPVVDVHMTVNTNVSQFTKSPNILHFAPDGTIRMTSNTAGGHVMTGTITYITNDPYP
ncbi:TPA: hypothetical protein U1U91_000242 [Streptococcus suis]|nr:hypothetical protein [Streptococcus suis]